MAESPSVNINVHFSEFFVPAQFASSNFSIPNNLAVFFVLPFNFLKFFSSSRVFAYLKQRSTIFVLNTFLMKFSLNSKEEPKSEGFDVRVSFVCESKVGFSI